MEEGSDAELTTLIYDAAARQIPLQRLISHIRRIGHGRDSTTSSTTTSRTNNNYNDNSRTRARARTPGTPAIRRILQNPGIDGTIPLLVACDFGPFAMVKYFIDLGIKFEISGESSCHNNTSRPLLPASSNSKKQFIYRGAGGLFIECQHVSNDIFPLDTITPMELAIERVRRTKNKIAEDWEILFLCMRHAHDARSRRPRPPVAKPSGPSSLTWKAFELQTPSRSSEIILRALGILPLDLILELISTCPRIDLEATDRLGRNILIKSIHLAKESQFGTTTTTTPHTINADEETIVDWKTIFKECLAKVGERRSSLELPPPFQGRTMLHLAAEEGLDWSNGLQVILETDYDLLGTHDVTSNLLPFMSAACGEETMANGEYDSLKRKLSKQSRKLGWPNVWNDLYSRTRYGHRERSGGKNGDDDDESEVGSLDDDLMDALGEENGRNDTIKRFSSMVRSAAGPQCNLDSTFELLRRNPAVLMRFIVVSGRGDDKSSRRRRSRARRRKRKRRNRRKNKCTDDIVKSLPS